jgi:hypothetical protein
MFYEVFVTRINGDVCFEAKDIDSGKVLAILSTSDDGEFPKMPTRGLNGIREGETPLAAIESMRQSLISIKGLARREPVTC